MPGEKNIIKDIRNRFRLKETKLHYNQRNKKSFGQEKKLKQLKI